MVQPEMSPGNRSDRFRNFSPTGEKQRMTWRLFLTRSMKNCITFSGVGGVFGASLLMMGSSSVMISPCSSRVNRFETRPVDHVTFNQLDQLDEGCQFERREVEFEIGLHGQNTCPYSHRSMHYSYTVKNLSPRP